MTEVGGRITLSRYLMIALTAFVCLGVAHAQSADALPSWRDGAAKTAIVEFVEAVTTEGGADYVPPEERIAVFDNDGTLWVEQPYYTQLAFALDRIRALAPEHPEWRAQQPFKAVLERRPRGAQGGRHRRPDRAGHGEPRRHDHRRVRHIVADWIAAARHPRFERPYTELVYQPMLELLEYLRASGFETYIVSGGGIEFMRPWAEQVYGIPPGQVIGSSIKTDVRAERRGAGAGARAGDRLHRRQGGKPVGIHKFISDGGRSRRSATPTATSDAAMDDRR